MAKVGRAGMFLFLTAGLAFAVLSFFLSVLVFRLDEAVSAAFGMNNMPALILMALIISVILIYISLRFIFKSRRLLTPLFFSLNAVYTLIFALVFYLLTYTSSSWSGFIFIFLYLPVIMAAVSWIFYFAYITITKKHANHSGKTKEAYYVRWIARKG